MSAFAADVLAMGRACVDEICVVDSLPGADGKSRAISYGRHFGGQAANTAVALARLGLTASFIGRVGDDAEGVGILEDLIRNEVDIRGIQVSRPGMSHRAFIWVTSATGSRSICWFEPDYLQIDESLLTPQMMTNCKVLHLDGHDSAALAAARMAKDEGVIVSLDAEEAYAFTGELLRLADIIVADASFPAKAGLSHTVDEALAELAQYGAQVAVITLGRDGAAALLEGKVRLDVPPARTDVVDTTGAGDAFRAGLLFGYVQGWEWPRALQMASVVAALSTRAIGGREGLPNLDEALEMLGGDPGVRRSERQAE